MDKFEEFESDGLIDKEYITEEAVPSRDIQNMISSLNMYTDNVEMLTKTYTDILEDENVVYLLTKISQNQVFMKHFPEFYKKNENGESVINCQQNSPYHRYGVFKHILHTIENVAKDSLKYSSHDMKILKWTMLLHDIGKPFVKTVNNEGYDSFTGHDDLSVVMAQKILDRFDFDDEDKNIILNLIKYHDKYLNEGDLTYDNLCFLARELENERDLFNLLIEVKLADNKAKSIDVYNKFMTVVGKYYDFSNEYFSNEETNKMFENTEKSEENRLEFEYKPIANKKSDRGAYKEGGSDEDITEKMITELTKDITNGKNLKCYYQPIVDLKKKQVDGYEVFYKIITDKDFSYKQILRKAKEFGKYDKLQQMLFVNALERFNEINKQNKYTEYINIDANSYVKYVNKARIYDLIEDKKIVFEFNNIEGLINSEIKDITDELFLRRGYLLVDNFESSKKNIKDLDKMQPKYVKYKLLNTDDNTINELKELSTYCLSNAIVLVVFGIDTKELFEAANACQVRFMQGEFFLKPTDGLDLTTVQIEEILKNTNDEMIV